MFRKYLALLRANWELILEYRAGMVIWMLSNILPLVMLGVWYSLAQAEPVGRYSSSDFVSYYLGILFVRQMTSAWVAWDLDREIRMGELSPKLLRPINPIHDHIALNLADKFFRLLTVLPFIVLIALLFPGSFQSLNMERFSLFVVSLVFAWGIRFMSQYCIGLLSFWITQSLALNEMWYAGLLMLGGVIAPLDLFPPGIVQLLQFLPFRFMLSFPVELLLNPLTSADQLVGLGVQVCWVLAFTGLYQILWKKGLKRYGAVGA